MYDFHPYFTNDGSVGLYNKEFNDIYHSADGALTEAFEKFVLPVNIDSLIHKDSIKVLDLCYGIGYNTKSFLNFIFEKYSERNFIKNFYHAKNNIETIHTNNILDNKNQIYNEQIYTNNISRDKENNFTSEHATCNKTIYTNNTLAKIYIKAVDYDKILTFLSPFIKTGVKNVKFQNLDFDYKPVDRILKNKENILHRKIKNEINFLIFDKIAQNTPEIFDNTDFLSIVNSEKYAEYFDKRIKGIFNFYRYSIYKYTPMDNKPAFLHNIYYRHISNCYKRRLKVYPLNDVDFELKNNDARQVIINDNNLYNLIFLDAFTPSKCPCLWSYEFFKELYKHLAPDGTLLTYSTSASIRSALMEAGFFIGNIYNKRENKFTGTIASKDKSQIKYELSEYDLGLLKTTAGIFYRDKNLTAQNEAIIEARNQEVKSSTRLSSSKYKKYYKQEDLCSTT